MREVIVGLVILLSGFLFYQVFQSDRLDRKTTTTLPRQVEKKEEVVLLVFGDLMLDRYVGQQIKKKGTEYPFAKIKNILGESDLVLVNLEGPFTSFTPRPLNPNNLIFTFDPKLLPDLKRLGFRLFSLANNHTLNFGEEGLEQTKNYMEQNGIDYFGDPANKETLSLIKVVKGIKIGFVGWNSLVGTDLNIATEEIKKLRQKTDFVVVYVHWGNEYQKTFSKSQQKEGHFFIDAGADVVFGSHPHVTQPIEVYKNKPIFYSLGNFLFDQTFSQETQQGLGIKLIFSQSQTVYFLFPTGIKNIQVNLLEEKKREIILRELSSRAPVRENIRKQILEGKIIFSSTNTNH